MDIDKYESATYILSQIKEYEAECNKFTTARYLRLQSMEMGDKADHIVNINNTYGEVADAYKRFIAEVQGFYTHRIGKLQKELDAL